MSRGNGLFIYIVKWTLEDVPVELSVSLCCVLMGPKWVRGCWSHGGKHLRKLTRYCVLSEECSAGFSATADLVSVCSLAFLDGPTGLRLTFTVTLLRKREIKTGGEAVITGISPWVTWEKGTVQVYGGDRMCSLIQGSQREKKINLWVRDDVLWSSNRLCRDWVGLKEIVGAGTLKAGRVLCLLFLALVSPSVPMLTCLLR